MLIKLFLFLLIALFGVSLNVNAGEKSKNPAFEDLRCERFTMEGLATLKAKLYENCDLTKPYSFSTSGDPLASKDTVTYCCQKK